MLKRLRRKFIVIVMGLVGAVLVAVLGSAFIATWQAKNDMVAESLERSIQGDMDSLPTFGGPRKRGDDGQGFSMLALLVEVSNEGIVARTSDAPVVINTQTLASIIDRVVEGGQAQGSDRSTHVAWTSVPLDEGGLRIAIVDTTSTDAILRTQAIRDLQIIAIALVALFAITWWLSDWALRPVEQAWQQQQRFVADASHELKTPLSVILANTQILEKDETLGEESMRWVRSTADEAQHMKTLVNDLLQLARADESAAGVSQGAMRHDDIDLSDMVESATLEFDAIAFERGCELEADVQNGIHVEGDTEWLERVVRILIDNACKYGETGSAITVRLADEGGHPTLTVNNRGNVIDPDDLPHLFERFYRSDKARSREGEGGFGLGLAIAKGIVDAHGGKISATSSETAGTTFTVVL